MQYSIRYIILFYVAGFLPNISMAQPYVESYSFGAFKDARRFSLDPFQRIFVTDDAAHTVTRFSVTGEEEKIMGGRGWGENQFDDPAGIDARFGIEIYVADYGNHRVQRFDKNMSFIGSLYTRENPDPSQRFGYPLDIALSRLGDLYIIDSENNRVLKVNTFSSVERTFGMIDGGEGQLHSPKCIDIGEDDRVYVLEDNRVAVYDLFGSYISEIGRGALHHPNGFCVTASDIYIVSDDSLFIWNLDGTLRLKLGKNEFLGAISLHDFRDVAFEKDNLFILTTTAVHIFHKPS